MSEISEKVIGIIDKFNRVNNCNNENSSMIVKNYQIDDCREFDVYCIIWNSVEYTIAGVFQDFDGIKVIEYNGRGEIPEPDEEEEVPVIM